MRDKALETVRGKLEGSTAKTDGELDLVKKKAKACFSPKKEYRTDIDKVCR